jgi:hypothetical protein
MVRDGLCDTLCPWFSEGDVSWTGILKYEFSCKGLGFKHWRTIWEISGSKALVLIAYFYTWGKTECRALYGIWVYRRNRWVEQRRTRLEDVQYTKWHDQTVGNLAYYLEGTGFKTVSCLSSLKFFEEDAGLVHELSERHSASSSFPTHYSTPVIIISVR